jgi:putative hydrolase of the HAD superfamily
LIDPWPSVGSVYARVASRHAPCRIAPATLDRRFHAAWRKRDQRFDYSRAGWAGMVRQTFAGLSPLATHPAFFADLYAHFATAEPWRIYADVLPALRALKRRGLKLAVISNWDNRLRPLLTALRLSPLFNSIVVSAEFGVHKPAPDIFFHAAKTLRLSPAAILHVGDSAEEDVAGARRAGFAALRIDRTRKRSTRSTIRSLAELPDRLRPAD